MFCEQCAVDLLPSCPNCDKQNNAGARFCRYCRTALANEDVQPAVPISSPPELAAQQLLVQNSESSEPTSFADGRYQVLGFLGEGAKKMVYLAQDTQLDRDVAFALIKTDEMDILSRARIAREAQAMGRLGGHPHIVTVFDVGEHERRPYLVEEFMVGGDVEGLIEGAQNKGLLIDEAISIAIATCRGLEFAHSNGIIHRDLKPGNVWLTADGVAKIGDFGLAMATDRSRLTIDGKVVGTASYMPPEQAMGGEMTPRADLYSLGAMLYDMVCGRPPFLGDDNIAIVGQHINTPPVAPTWHRSDCPRPLEALIMRLLAKNPAERPESASDVLAALESISAFSSDQSISEPVQAANVLDSLAADVFVGRHNEMDDLKAALEGALGGRGRMVMLVGDPGIGKTRTAQELTTYAGLRGAQVLWGRSLENRGAPPYWPWIQVIRSYVQEREPNELSTEMGSGAADIAEIVSDVKERLPGLQPPPSLGDPEQERFRLFDSITTFLKNASRSKPLVIILDNLHWADKPSLLLLEFLAPELVDSRLLVIGTYRDADLSRQHPLVETLGELNRERLFERVLLRGLTEEDARNFIEIVSGVTPPASLVRTIHAQTEGNPLFLTEVVRLLVQEGDLTSQTTADRDSWEVRIPEGVREVIGRRLNRLTERYNQTLTVSAVIGREFELRQLTRLVDDMSEDRLVDVVEEGLSARVIEEMPNSVGRYQFTHALIQQTLMDELSTTRRVRLHARIIDVFEELHRDAVESYATELAYHAAEAESIIGPESLVKYSIAAGEQALVRFAWEDALVHFQKADEARDQNAMDEASARLLFGLARAQIEVLPSYRRIEAIPNLSSAFEYYSQSGNIEQAVNVAEYHFTTRGGELTAAEQLIPRALSLAPSGSLLAGRLLARYGPVLGLFKADYEGAMETFDKALEIARSNGDTTLEITALSSSAPVSFYHLQFQHVLDATQNVTELSSNLDAPLIGSVSDLFRGLAFQGDLKNARRSFELSQSMAERVRHRFHTAQAAANLASVSWSEGDFDDARQHADLALSLAPEDSTVLFFATLLDSTVGDFAASNAHIDRQLETINQTNAGPNIDYALSAFCIPFAAQMSGSLSQLRSATELANAVVSSHNVTPLLEYLARIGLAVTAFLTHDESEATEQYPAIAELKKTTPFLLTSVDLVLGLLAHTMGNLDNSQTHFEDAIAICRESGYITELAWSLHDYADMLLERDGDGDKVKATSLLDKSLQISSDLGMRPLMERVSSKRDILKA
jgi:tetratricopeptide (TPR) repeat protein